MAAKKTKTLSLTQALSQLLSKQLLPDLKTRAEDESVVAALQLQYDAEKNAERTADTFREFVARTLEQVGAAWILSCVFVRTLEDRKLLVRNRIAGEGAADSEQLFFEIAPSLTARDYLLTVFQEVSSLPGVADVLGVAHNPAYRLSPSNDAARALIEFFRERDVAGALRWQFAGEDTRFLGDLYQDLSEEVRKRYALLQTPDFVESFILDQTLTPAIAEFGLSEVRVIDPTCGSGHFLLGAFDRLLDARLREAPGVDVRTHALDALAHVYGVDVNPYAVAIARFRLTLVYLARCGFGLLSQAPRLRLNLVVADSLLHGAQDSNAMLFEQDAARGDEAAWGYELFALDDPREATRILSQRYHAVVGNPPYITCKDPVLREQYRKAYESASGKYALAAPFAERLFQLAVDAGFVGMINANSFMKRAFGKALVQLVLPKIDLTQVIDAAGVYIPGHKTATVLLFGRNRSPTAESVCAVRGKRGEPGIPGIARCGVVWRSIAASFCEIGFENDYVSVENVPRRSFHRHPWSLGGGGATELKELLEERASKTLGEIAVVGVGGMSNADDVYISEPGSWKRYGMPSQLVRPLVVGEALRDWHHSDSLEVYFPYDSDLQLIAPTGRALQLLWPYRTSLEGRAVFGGGTYRSAGRPWWEWHQVTKDRYRTPLSITFAFVATHNHFVLDRGSKIFKQSAPIIKLSELTSEDEHLALLAYLNSSTACFFMRQVLSPKGMNNGSKANSTPFLVRFEWDGTKMKSLPLPPSDLTDLLPLAARAHEELSKRAALDFRTLLAASPSCEQLGEVLDQLVLQREAHRDMAVALLEEVDWRVYKIFELVDDCYPVALDDICSLSPGERPFEIELARNEPGSVTTGWFHWNEYVPATDIPNRLSSRQRESMSRRIALLARSPELGLLESPLCKRRWVQPKGKAAQELETDRKMLVTSLRAWLLDMLEAEMMSHLAPIGQNSMVERVRQRPYVSQAIDWAWPHADSIE
ncbi:MAG: hypothetical protein RL701_7446, partial [Pseudomonadota bacterium]